MRREIENKAKTSAVQAESSPSIGYYLRAGNPVFDGSENPVTMDFNYYHREADERLRSVATLEADLASVHEKITDFNLDFEENQLLSGSITREVLDSRIKEHADLVTKATLLTYSLRTERRLLTKAQSLLVQARANFELDQRSNSARQLAEIASVLIDALIEATILASAVKGVSSLLDSWRINYDRPGRSGNTRFASFHVFFLIQQLLKGNDSSQFLTDWIEGIQAMAPDLITANMTGFMDQQKLQLNQQFAAKRAEEQRSRALSASIIQARPPVSPFFDPFSDDKFKFNPVDDRSRA